MQCLPGGVSVTVRSWHETVLLSDSWFNTLVAEPRLAAMPGICCPRFKRDFWSWCRNRGGTSRGGYRDTGCCCCGLSAVGRLALFWMLVTVEMPMFPFTGWGWLSSSSGTVVNRTEWALINKVTWWKQQLLHLVNLAPLTFSCRNCIGMISFWLLNFVL